MLAADESADEFVGGSVYQSRSHPAPFTPRSGPRSITGSSHLPSCWRRSWRCSTPRSRTLRCLTSQAGLLSARARQLLRLAEQVTLLNPALERWTDYFAQARTVRGGVTRAVANQQGMGMMSQMVREQARVMAYLEAFWIFAIMALAALPLVLLMK
jgi:hypothetical protein